MLYVFLTLFLREITYLDGFRVMALEEDKHSDICILNVVLRFQYKRAEMG